MSDQIPFPSVEFLPVGSILPFLKAEDVTEEWMVMDGQLLFEEDYPEFVARMSYAYDNRDPERAVDMAVFDFWKQYGGVICNWFVTLPTIPPEKVIELAFGFNYLLPEGEPVLAIKVRRPVSNDGDSGKMDDPDPDS